MGHRLPVEPDGVWADNTTIGRDWPIFGGERGEYELLAGNAASARTRLGQMAAAANDGYLLPEQVWAPTSRRRAARVPARQGHAAPPRRWPGRTPSSCASPGRSTPGSRSSGRASSPAATRTRGRGRARRSASRRDRPRGGAAARPRRARRHARGLDHRPAAGPPRGRRRRPRATRSASRTAASTPTAGTSPARWAASGRRRSSSSTASGSASTTSGSGRRRSSPAAGATRATTCPPTDGLQVAAHRLRPRRPPRRAVRAQADQPGRRRRGPSRSRSTRTPSCMGAYPWGSGRRRTRATNLADTAPYDDGALLFSDAGHAAAARRRAARLRRARRRPTAGPAAAETGAGHRGPAGRGHARAAPRRHDARAPATTARSARAPAASCATASRSAARDSETLWIAVAGSDQGAARRARRAATPRCATPTAQLAAQDRARASSSARARSGSSLPGDRQLQEAIDWGKQNLADLTQTATDLQIRLIDQGKQFPAPLGHRHAASRWFGAGYPDYPWIFATDGEYTAFAARRARPVRGDQGPPARAARHLRDPQRRLGQGRARDRHRRLGLLRRSNTPDGPGDFNTDETAKFPSAVALVWRWTGDDRLPRRALRLRGAQPALRRRPARRRQRRLARGLGQRRARRAWATEKLDNAVYLIRGLYDLADMARAKRDRAHDATWASDLADELRERFEDAWWIAAADRSTRTRSATRRRADPAEALDRRRRRWRPS